jgi:hypothetical protein
MPQLGWAENIMWTQSSPTELARRRRKAFQTNFLWGFAIAGVLCVAGFELIPYPERWFTPLGTISLLISFLVGLLYGLYAPTSLETDVWVCPACQKEKAADGDKKCACGGEYGDRGELTWVANPAAAPTTGNPAGSGNATNPG